MNKMIPTILIHFQDVLARLNTESQERGPLLRLGVPPTFLIVKQIEFFTDESSQQSKVLARWKVSITSVEEFIDNPDTINLERNGMYYSHGFGDFSIHSNGETVRIGWQVGPRYGRGYEYSIIKRNNAIELINQKLLWIS